MREIIFSFPLPASALQETFSDLARASLPDRPTLFPAHHCSAVRAATLQRTRACARCKRAFHKLRAACLREARRKVFRKASPGGFQLRADSNCTCARWPSSKVQARDNRELRLRIQSAAGV